jgi:hypothetical protein
MSPRSQSFVVKRTSVGLPIDELPDEQVGVSKSLQVHLPGPGSLNVNDPKRPDTSQ